MNAKRASVVEIYKNYCIVVTEDGRFLKQVAPAGTYEIGDSFTILPEKEPDKVKEKPDIFRVISRVAAGFAMVAVIAFGSYFGINFLRTDRSAMTVAVNEGILEEAVQAPLEENADNSGLPDGQDDAVLLKQESGEEQLKQENVIEENDDILLQDTAESEELAGANETDIILYEGIHDLVDTDTEVLIDYKDIMIDYTIGESGIESGESDLGKSLLFNFIQNKKDYFFNGNIDTVLNDANKSATRTVRMLFEDFEYGAKRTEEVILENDETSFTLVIYGSFN